MESGGTFPRGTDLYITGLLSFKSVVGTPAKGSKGFSRVENTLKHFNLNLIFDMIRLYISMPFFFTRIKLLKTK